MWVPGLIVLVSVLLDQATKYYARYYFLGSWTGEEPKWMRPAVEVIPGFFNLVYVENRGAAFGSFSQHTGALSVISAVMLVVVVVFRKHIFNDVPAERIAFGLLLGGIIGNLWDRVGFGYVTDFLDFYIGALPKLPHWPAFNVADSCICVGVGIYIVSSWRVQRAEERRQRAAADQDQPSGN